MRGSAHRLRVIRLHVVLVVIPVTTGTVVAAIIQPAVFNVNGGRGIKCGMESRLPVPAPSARSWRRLAGDATGGALP